MHPLHISRRTRNNRAPVAKNVFSGELVSEERNDERTKAASEDTTKIAYMQNLVQYFVPYIGKNGTIFANFIKNICVCRKKAVPLRRFCVRRGGCVRV